MNVHSSSKPPQSPTELRNPRTTDIDQVPVEQMLELMYDEEARAIDAVRTAAPEVAQAVEAAYECLVTGGNIHYFGAGASGRLAVLDATESTPTFGTEPGMFAAHFAGGAAALTDSGLDFEDSAELGAHDAATLTSTDLAIGITASGSTAYVRGALGRAHETGARTVLVSCNPHSVLRELADIAVIIDTGPEALTGSTRLKAGTATKVVLNSFSTTLMIRAGRTYSNLMVGLVATNGKLRDRAVRVLVQATACSEEQGRMMLDECDGQIPLALVRLLSGCSADEAKNALVDHTSVRSAARALGQAVS